MTMRAYTHTYPGPPPSVLTLSTLPKPTLTSPTQILIRVSHCALNPGASIIMHLLPFAFRASPAMPEMDFSGALVEAAPDVPESRNLVPGTKVFGSIPVGQHVRSACGALAEYVVVDHGAAVKAPNNVPLSELSGLGVAGATALELFKASNVKEGDRVLVNAAGGGIGHLILQMCCEQVGESGKVYAIASTRNETWLRDIAPRCEVIRRDEKDLIKYLKESFADKPFDVVVDAAGIQDLFHASPAFLKESGAYVSVGPRAQSYTYFGVLATLGSMAKNMLWPRVLGGTPRRYIQVAAASSLESLEALANLVKGKKLKVHVGLCVGWGEILSAYRRLLSGGAGGKIVVRIPDEEH